MKRHSSLALQDQRVLVVGGTSGMGFGVAQAALDAGASVVVAALRRAGGSITFLSGVAAVKPRAGMVMVSVAFAALEALSRALAVELGPLRVNTIRPGFIDSDMWSFLNEEAREQIRAKVRSTF